MVIGEICAGILLQNVFFFLSGITILGSKLPPFDFSNAQGSDFFIFAELGIIFLLFLSGLETDAHKIKKAGKVSTFTAIGGVIAPFFLGFLTGYFFTGSFELGVIIGTILIATSVGVTARTLLDLHLIDSNSGVTILGGAVLDDLIAIILLAFVISTGENPFILTIKTALFFIFIICFFILKIVNKIMDVSEKIHIPKSLMSIALALCLIVSVLANELHIAAITGAFLAGLLIGITVQSSKLIEDIRTIGYGFFIPLFFVSIGASINFSEFLNLEDPVFAISGFSSLAAFIIATVMIIIVAVFGKIVGCGIGARFAGMSRRESLQVGVGMVPRMEVALIVVTAAASSGVLMGHADDQLLAMTILLGLVTTLLTPLLIKATFK